MFVGRERELAQLEDAYGSGRFEMVVVYGRRRVGKTALLNRFAENKGNVCFFTAQRTVARENLEALSVAALASGVAAGSMAAPVYRSFADAVRAVFERARNERLVFVIDEYPYLAESEPGISSLLQTMIDQRKEESQLMLVLCGSSMSFMKEQVLGEQSPLYGRRTCQIELLPFDVFDAARLLGARDPVRAVELYALVGGVPLYLEQLDAARDTAWNIANRMLAPGAFLAEEAENFLSQGVRSPATYNAVVAAIAAGCVRPQEIADRTGIKSPLVQQYLARLEKLSVVRRVTPLIKAKRRQVRYEISDNLFRFHYRFGVKYETAVGAGMAEAVAHEIVERELSAFVGPVFEEVSRQWLLRQMASGAIRMIPLGVGRWWGTNSRTHKEEEIDVVAQGSNNLVLGECKWQDTPVEASVFGTLRRRASLLDEEGTALLYVFAKSGFEDQCRARAAGDERVSLVTLAEMLEE